ncbi:fibrous sheath-interacting protein 2-like [Acipenser oxyrinchus oxyrinchus]|uniref:Fibrous sheath-interacting protein 2-like n=1 Tax=Acipenser oxyrinchus oxyrinchus TaxID=40147 RepID=A0AAD8D672_ACIOX|nr:fibrous sheath-interacting protein 2-like [Acipenser oxyrinchus oxyrinchus]
MESKYKSLHDPHLSGYYNRKDVLKRLRKGGFITEHKKIICTLKDFDEYRQYLTTIKLDFEKNYMREQQNLVKQLLELQEQDQLPEGIRTSELREWLLEEGCKDLRDMERTGRNRYIFSKSYPSYYPL